MTAKNTFEPLPGEPGAYRAKFGRVVVTLHPETGVREIWRGRDASGAAIKAGEWPARGYWIRVHGDCTSCAGFLDSAMAHGEELAWRAGHNKGVQANRIERFRYALSPERAAEVKAADHADLVALLARFPFEPGEIPSGFEQAVADAETLRNKESEQ